MTSLPLTSMCDGLIVEEQRADHAQVWPTLKQLIPHAHHHVIPDSKHGFCMEYPDETASTMLHWIKTSITPKSDV